MSDEQQEETPLYGRLLVRFTKPFPNFDFSFIKPVRKKAIESLNLSPGARVLDVGCGPGGSFPFLVDAVGNSGKVVGIEISPLHSDMARSRIEANGWRNVEVITTPAKDADLDGRFDGLLMFAAPDVYGSAEELGNIVPYLQENARVAAFGAKLATGSFGRLLNPIINTLYKLSFSTTPTPSLEPWQPLTTDFDITEVREYFFGLMFLVSGQLRSMPSKP
ncbi:MAG: methyltransferase domain-containing protein [Pyrinomonadaceae bacterium]